MARDPLLLDIKRSSLDDGPGIRSVVFFKGCPLSCVWCQNPEGIQPGAELQRDVEACIACGACADTCSRAIARPAALAELRDDCVQCGACVVACPAAARRIAGRALSVQEVVAQLLEDEPFYRRSEGGVTLSGGEPAMFPEFAGAVAAGVRAQGVHVLLETCGQFSWQPFEEHLLPHLSTVYFDLKLADATAHRQHCGSDNQRIHDNLSRLVAAGTAELRVRVPLVPGITDTPDNLTALADRITGAGLSEVALMPYNPLWLGKRRGLGMPLPYMHDRWMPAEVVASCEAVMRQRGLRVLA